MRNVKKIFIIFFVFAFFISIIFNYKVHALNEEDDDFELEVFVLSLNKLSYYSSQNEEVKLNNPYTSEHSIPFETYSLLLTNNDTTICLDNLNEENFTIKSSNENVLIAYIKDGSVYIKGITEGRVDIYLTYKYQNKEYSTIIENWTVIPEYFGISYFNISNISDQVQYSRDVILLVDSKNIELNENESKDVNLIFTTGTIFDTVFPNGFCPQGYDEFTFYNYDWKSLDESVARVEISGNGKKATITAVSPGLATIECKVNSVDGQSVTKIINVTVFGERDETYKLDYENPKSIGPNQNVLSINESILSNLALYNIDDGSKLEIDNNKLKILVSNPNIIDINDNGDVIAKSEGSLTITYYYITEKTMYIFKEDKCIVSDRFSTGDIPLISNSIVNLSEIHSTDEIYLSLIQGGTFLVEYPEGYNADNYYSIEWRVENENVASIYEVSEKNIKIYPNDYGSTKIYCIITTADGNQVIEKTIDVFVSEQFDISLINNFSNLIVRNKNNGFDFYNANDDDDNNNELIKPNKDTISTNLETNIDSTVSPIIYPNAGKKEIIIITLITVSIFILILLYKKHTNKMSL